MPKGSLHHPVSRAMRGVAKPDKRRSRSSVGQLVGWLFLHPDGWVETDYFQTQIWVSKGKRVPRERWHALHRPECRMVKATLAWEVPDAE